MKEVKNLTRQKNREKKGKKQIEKRKKARRGYAIADNRTAATVSLKPNLVVEQELGKEVTGKKSKEGGREPPSEPNARQEKTPEEKIQQRNHKREDDEGR